MRFIRFVIKIPALPVMLILRLLCLLVMVLTNLSAYVLGPLALFIAGCGIYCLAQTRWIDTAILTGMEGIIFGTVFAAGWLTGMAEELCKNLSDFLHS